VAQRVDDRFWSAAPTFVSRVGACPPRPTILIADGEPLLRALARITLAPSYAVFEASDGPSTLQLVQQTHPDLVLLDIDLPGLAGFAVYDRLKTGPLGRTPAVVLLSGRLDGEDRDRGVAVGADGYLTKPFSPSTLLGVVGRSLPEAAGRSTPLPPTGLPPSAPDAAATRPDLTQALVFARELEILLRATSVQAERLRCLGDFGRQLVTASDVRAVLPLAVQSATAFSGLQSSRLYLPVGQPPHLALHAGTDEGCGFAEGGAANPPERCAERALASRQPLTVAIPVGGIPGSRDLAGDPSLAVYLPLLSPFGPPVGVLALGSSSFPGHLTVPTLLALQLLASQLAAAIESIQVNERLRQNLAARLAIHDANEILGSTLGPDEVARHLLNLAIRMTGYSAGAISLADGDDSLHLWQQVGPAPILDLAVSCPTLVVTRRTALTSRRAQFASLPGCAPSDAGLFPWCLPLRSQDRALGVLEVYGVGFQEAAIPVDVLVSIANQTASRLEHAQRAFRRRRITRPN
jgi:CheY-like chemotaxis protein